MEITAGDSFAAGAPRPLFAVRLVGGPADLASTVRWDVTPDGQRFLVATQPAESDEVPISIVLNWKG